ncbi:MAG: hypothetical protein ACOZAK_02730 [Patescibacteria group bacterium]
MQLAKSRLKNTSLVQPAIKNREPLNKQQKKTLQPLQNYLQLIPTLTMAMLCYFGLWLLIKFIHPTVIQNWIFPNSYLPFHFLLGLGNFFLFSFLGRRKIWGFFSSVLLGWLAFLQLQQIELDFWAIGSSLVLAITASFWWLVIKIFNKGN